jgi:hypothetical protein
MLFKGKCFCLPRIFCGKRYIFKFFALFFPSIFFSSFFPPLEQYSHCPSDFCQFLLFHRFYTLNML